MLSGWLVNDTLTCIPGTKTFWHDLLENIDGLEDKTFGYTPFDILPNKIEIYAKTNTPPDYIIRNATFFRQINISAKTISFLQDHYSNYLRQMQLDVCKNSYVTVFNSPFVKNMYKEIVKNHRTLTIPIGIDFNFFLQFDDIKKEKTRIDMGILPNSILFVGANNTYPKGFNHVLELINNTDFNFCLVMKDNFILEHQRVKCFGFVDHATMVDIYNSCALLICTSEIETLHLAGIEAAACGLPIVATNVGIYYNRPDEEWGTVQHISVFQNKISFILENRNMYHPRKYFLSEGLNKECCINKWKNLILDIEHNKL